MIVDLGSAAFPSFTNPIRARWAPVFLSPIRGSDERLVIGVAVFNDTGFHIEAANALTRLQCLYGAQADIVIQVAGLALDELKFELASRSGEAVTDFRPSITGISIGSPREAEGILLSCCRFRGHRDKVFLEPEDGDATTEVQPRVQARGGEAGAGTRGVGIAGGARSGPA